VSKRAKLESKEFGSMVLENVAEHEDCKMGADG
jgi:hypothetical protein